MLATRPYGGEEARCVSFPLRRAVRIHSGSRVWVASVALEVGLGIAGQHVSQFGELNFRGSTTSTARTWLRTPSRRIEASSSLQIRSSS